MTATVGKAKGRALSNIDIAWIVILAWVAVELVIFSNVGSWSMVAFTLVFGFLFGGLAWRFRASVRPAFRRAGLDNIGGFLLLAFWISVFEEVLCYGLGNRVANPILWADIIQVSVTWLFWFATWYLYIAKRYAFSKKEALLVGASVGILYECVSSGTVFGNPLVLLMSPMVVIIYAAIFVLPLQLIDLKGKDDSAWKYPVGIVLPYLASLPMGVVLAIILPR
jgi:hypothetical protein